MLLLILTKHFNNLNLFEIFILLSNLFAIEHHWGKTDRCYNHISLLSLGSHIKKKKQQGAKVTKQFCFFFGDWMEAERSDNQIQIMQWSGLESIFRVFIQNVKGPLDVITCAATQIPLWVCCAISCTGLGENLIPSSLSTLAYSISAWKPLLWFWWWSAEADKTISESCMSIRCCP